MINNRQRVRRVCSQTARPVRYCEGVPAVSPETGGDAAAGPARGCWEDAAQEAAVLDDGRARAAAPGVGAGLRVCDVRLVSRITLI